jgi:hypothetical protein
MNARWLGIVAALLAGCSDDDANPSGPTSGSATSSAGGQGSGAGGEANGGAGATGGTGNAGGGGGSAQGGSGPEEAFLYGRFANFDSNLPPFDVCWQTFKDPTLPDGAVPLFSSNGGPAGGLGFDQVSLRVPIPLAADQLFLVHGDTTDCSDPEAKLTSPSAFEPVFPAAGGLGLEANSRMSFAATDPAYFGVMNPGAQPPGELISCPDTSACLLFAHYLSDLPFTGQGPTLTLERVENGTSTPIPYGIAMGDDYIFSDVVFPEVPLAGTSVLLAVRETGSPTAIAEFELTAAAGEVFSIWVVGHPEEGGDAAPRVWVCRDLAADVGGLGDCTRYGG